MYWLQSRNPVKVNNIKGPSLIITEKALIKLGEEINNNPPNNAKKNDRVVLYINKIKRSPLNP